MSKIQDQQKVPQFLFESCEERLVLSAQALMDLVADLATDNSAVGIEPHMSEAHSASGLNSVIEQFGLTGEGQTVAVIDSGIAWDHVALGQGYGPGYRVVGGWDFAENDNQPYDDGPSGFHGTHVSGVIGSQHAEHPGVARDVDLVALRVFNDLGQGQLDWVENALRWVHDNQNAFENPITTVNISVGTLETQDGIPAWSSLEDELAQLNQDGIVVVASAGNSFQELQNTELTYPASSEYVLPVASVGADGNLSDFSQRAASVLAAPGEDLTSSVPDHVLGRDGKIDDFTTSSGTSMAAPYVAGASVLVRQAMEMVGVNEIDSDAIVDHLRSTAVSVFDQVTGQYYDRLNLDEAISNLIPQDVVGNETWNAHSIDFQSIQAGQSLETWINYLGDQDVYQFTAAENGTLDLGLSSAWNDSLAWSLSANGQILVDGGLGNTQVPLIAGQEYQLSVFASAMIGPGSLELGFDANLDSEGQSTGNGSFQDLGAIEYLETTAARNTEYSAVASSDGLFSIQWNEPGNASGRLVVSHGDSSWSTSQWVDGSLRLDLDVEAGDAIQWEFSGVESSQGEMHLANLVHHSGANLSISGTGGQDRYALNLRNGVSVQVGQIEYAFAAGEISSLRVDAGGSSDQIEIQGSQAIESVELRPGHTTLSNRQLDLQVELFGVEEVAFAGGGGNDQIYMYDSNTDDTLRAYPGEVELTGVGYRFQVDDVSRVFVHATGTGEDIAYVYDSAGDDTLSARPQFTSIRGEGYFNYVRGFERVYAYANAGGHDVATLYDSAGADRFSAAGESVLISGPGFSSHVRGFDDVAAIAHAGGQDRATLYGSANASDWYQGADYVAFQESGAGREARGFETVEAYENMQPISLQTQSYTTSEAEQILKPAQQAEATPTSSRLMSELGIHAETLSIEELQSHKLHLPEERLLDDEELERQLLNEAFSDFSEQFDA